MYGIPWYTDFCRKYVKDHPRIAERCKSFLGPLSTSDNARRWAYVTWCYHVQSSIVGILSFLWGDYDSFFVSLFATGISTTLGDHYSACTLAKRAEETRLFLDTLDSSEQRIRIGAMYHLAGVGTKEAVGPLKEIARTKTGSERRSAILTLGYIANPEEMDSLIDFAAHDAWLLKRISWANLYATRLHWEGQWNLR